MPDHPSTNAKRRPMLRAALFLSTLLVSGTTPLMALRITEVFYHPAATEDPQQILEFVELFNDSSVGVDLGGAYFSSGIDFVFPEGTFLSAQSYLVVCRDAEAVGRRYGIDNVIGNFARRLSDGGERLEVLTHAGAPLASIRYRDRGDWPVAPDGAGYSLSLRRPHSDGQRVSDWAVSREVGGTPGEENFPPTETIDTVLIAANGPDAHWLLRKGRDPESGRPAEFSNPPDAWYQLDFDASQWEAVEAPVGYNAPGIATELNDMRRQYLAFALRREFELTPEAIDEAERLVLSLRVDDGAVAYVNGETVATFNLDLAPGEVVSATTRARVARNMEDGEITFELPRELFRAGVNVVGVQVHNAGAGSDDAGVSVSLVSHRQPDSEPPAAVAINEVIVAATDSQRRVELMNLTSVPVDLSGYELSDDPGGSTGFRFAAGTTIAANGFLTLTETELGFELGEDRIRLFLHDATGRLVDAMQQDGAPTTAPSQSHARFPDGVGGWWVSTQPTPNEANRVDLERSVVINEIMFHPRQIDQNGQLIQDTSFAEYIELLNVSDRRVSLDGFRFDAGIQFAFGAEHEMAPGEYLVVARRPEWVRQTYQLTPQQVVGPPSDASAEEIERFGRLSNRGEALRLVDPFGNTVDEVSYADEGDWDEFADHGGSSLELIDPLHDNSFPHAWTASDESAGASWTEIDYTAPLTFPSPGPPEFELHLYLIARGECLIDAVSVVADDGEELVPNGSFEGDDDSPEVGTGTEPWRLWGTHDASFRTTQESSEGSASLHLVALGSGNNKANRLEVDLPTVEGASQVRIRLAARWLAGSNMLHISGHNNAYGRTVALSLPPRMGTPGRENRATRQLLDRRGDTNLGPVVKDVRHDPAVPNAGSQIAVTAHVVDGDGIDRVELVYTIDGTETPARLPMLDDGANRDGVAGDGIFGVIIGSLQDNTIVDFWIETEDSARAVHAYPWNAPQRTLNFIVAPPLESSVLRYRLVMNQASREQLNTQLLHSNRLVPATLVFEESEIFYEVGVRYQGSPWGRAGRDMFRVRLPGDRRLRGETKRINIKEQNSQEQGTARQLFFKGSVPGAIVPISPRYEYGTVRINNPSQDMETKGIIRPIDKDYVAFNWPEDAEGTGWKIAGKIAFDDDGSMSGAEGAFFRLYRDGPYPGVDHFENLRHYFEPRVRKDEDRFAELVRLLQAMDQRATPDSEYEATLEDIMNVESWLRTFLLRLLLADTDTIGTVGSGGGKNAYLYYAPVEERLYLIPWDPDFSFGNSDHELTPPGDRRWGLTRIFTRPKYRRLYGRLLHEYVHGAFSREYVQRWTDLVSETTDAVSVGPANGAVNFTAARGARVLDFLGDAATAALSITTPSPFTATSTSAVIAGTAPLTAATLQISTNNAPFEPFEPEWIGPPQAIPWRWQHQLTQLRSGENTIRIAAFEPDGATIDVAAITVRLVDREADFLRGDVNGDGTLDLSDPVEILNYLFRETALTCLDAADVNDDGRLNVSDPIRVVLHLFAGGPSPPTPFPDVGADPTEDALRCF